MAIRTITHSKEILSIILGGGAGSRLYPLTATRSIMHPGPINRGVELDSDVADSKQSIILQQVENGVAVRMAVLYLLANRNTA